MLHAHTKGKKSKPTILFSNLTNVLTPFSFTSKSSSARQSRICFSNNTFTNQLICVHVYWDGSENEHGSAISLQNLGIGRTTFGLRCFCAAPENFPQSSSSLQEFCFVMRMTSRVTSVVKRDGSLVTM